MKKLASIMLLLLIGCVGSNTPRNPMKAKGGAEPWWQADTAHVTSNSPWEKFIRPKVVQDTQPPPVIFPEDWKRAKPAVKSTLDSRQSRRIIIPYPKESSGCLRESNKPIIKKESLRQRSKK